jgi:mannose-1-phosphate guanylyltransferase
MHKPPFILILAGGAGTRFWPASRENLPKQFLDITGSGKSLIRQTVDRFLDFIPLDHIFVITHEQYGDLVKQAIPELKAHQIICEPSRNNTAASIAYASLKLAKWDPDGICVVAPADHVIQNEAAFKEVLEKAIAHAAETESLITLGITPTRPDTGYGYIEYDRTDPGPVTKVISFKEKPDIETAEAYYKSGSYAWNAGIFIWKLKTILSAFETHAHQIISTLHADDAVLNTPAEEAFIKAAYPGTDSVSVDYAILEKSAHVYTIPCDIGWSDLGTWNSLHEFHAKDERGNAVISKQVHLEKTGTSLVLSSSDKLIVIKGLEDYIIVDTPDCLLIYPRSDEQQIKNLKESLRQKGFDSYL